MDSHLGSGQEWRALADTLFPHSQLARRNWSHQISQWKRAKFGRARLPGLAAIVGAALLTGYAIRTQDSGLRSQVSGAAEPRSLFLESFNGLQAAACFGACFSPRFRVYSTIPCHRPHRLIVNGQEDPSYARKRSCSCEEGLFLRKRRDSRAVCQPIDPRWRTACAYCSRQPTPTKLKSLRQLPTSLVRKYFTRQALLGNLDIRYEKRSACLHRRNSMRSAAVRPP
jgi:hypothetical protein